MELPIEAMGKLSIENLIAMLAMFWIFYVLLAKKFDKIDHRFDKIENDMKEMRTSLNRLEGALMSKECCMLKPDNQMKKAE